MNEQQLRIVIALCDGQLKTLENQVAAVQALKDSASQELDAVAGGRTPPATGTNDPKAPTGTS